MTRVFGAVRFIVCNAGRLSRELPLEALSILLLSINAQRICKCFYRCIIV